MVAGLPGTGIGGLFYVVSALLVPFRAGRRRGAGRRGTSVGWATGLAVMALAIALAIWLTGWGLGLLVQHVMPQLGSRGTAQGPIVHPSNLVRTVSLVLAAATLVGVIGAVEVARLTLRRPVPLPANEEAVPLRKISRGSREAA